MGKLRKTHVISAMFNGSVTNDQRVYITSYILINHHQIPWNHHEITIESPLCDKSARGFFSKSKPLEEHRDPCQRLSSQSGLRHGLLVERLNGVLLLGLVVAVSTPLKNMKVNWNDYSQYMGKKQMFQTTNQFGKTLVNHPYEMLMVYDALKPTFKRF